MNLDDLKKNYLTIILVAIIVVLGSALAVNQYRQSRSIQQYEEWSKKGNREDPYDRAVRNQILKIYPSIKKMYQAYTAKNPSKREGSIMVDWSIDTDGEPVKVEVVTSDFGDREFESNIVKAIQGITFPEPPVKRYVTHTFRFKDTEKGGK